MRIMTTYVVFLSKLQHLPLRQRRPSIDLVVDALTCDFFRPVINGYCPSTLSNRDPKPILDFLNMGNKSQPLWWIMVDVVPFASLIHPIFSSQLPSFLLDYNILPLTAFLFLRRRLMDQNP